MMRKLLCLAFWLPLTLCAQDQIVAQQAENLIYEGNEAFDALNATEAEKNYRRALATGAKKDIAQYNMGTTLQQDNYIDEALRAYNDVAKTTKERPKKHRTFHNIGNALMQAKDYSGAVEAYKNALRNNPQDDETRYNYALAKKMLEDQEKENEDQQDQQDQQDQNNKDQEKDQDQDKQGENEQDKKDTSGEEGENEKENKESDNKRSLRAMGRMSKTNRASKIKKETKKAIKNKTVNNKRTLNLKKCPRNCLPNRFKTS